MQVVGKRIKPLKTSINGLANSLKVTMLPPFKTKVACKLLFRKQKIALFFLYIGFHQRMTSD
jgi:hypothetical protein